MAHAERCPICYGSGKLGNKGWTTGNEVAKTCSCYGCGGKGWVEVRDDYNPYLPYPPVIEEKK